MPNINRKKSACTISRISADLCCSGPSAGVDRRLVIVTRSFISLASCYARTNGALGLRLIIPHRVCLAQGCEDCRSPQNCPSHRDGCRGPTTTHPSLRPPAYPRERERTRGERDLRDMGMRAGLERWNPGGRRNTFCKEGS